MKAIDVDFGTLEFNELCNVPVTNDGSAYLISYFSAPLDIGINKLRLRWSLKDKKVEGEGLGWFTAEETKCLKMRNEDCKAVNRFFQENGL